MSTTFYFSYALLWILVAVQTLFALILLHIFSQRQSMHERREESRLEPLPIGAKAAPFKLRSVFDDRRLDSTSLLGKRHILLFLSTTCSSCKYLAAELKQYSEVELKGLLVICDGTQRGCLNHLDPLETLPILRAEDSAISANYRVASFPTAVAIGEDGLVELVRHPNSLDEVKRMLSRVQSGTAAREDKSHQELLLSEDLQSS